MVSPADCARAAMTAALPALQLLDQATQPQSGLKAQLGVQQRPVAYELAQRLRLVTLGQVHLDEGNTGAFPERLGPHGRSGGASRFTPAANGHEPLGQRLQGMQSKLPPVFGL